MTRHFKGYFKILRESTWKRTNVESNKTRFGIIEADLDPFFQGRKRSMNLYMVHSGEKILLLVLAWKFLRVTGETRKLVSLSTCSIVRLARRPLVVKVSQEAAAFLLLSRWHRAFASSPLDTRFASRICGFNYYCRPDANIARCVCHGSNFTPLNVSQKRLSPSLSFSCILPPLPRVVYAQFLLDSEFERRRILYVNSFCFPFYASWKSYLTN